jgi:hypothetical protein
VPTSEDRLGPVARAAATAHDRSDLGPPWPRRLGPAQRRCPPAASRPPTGDRSSHRSGQGPPATLASVVGRWCSSAIARVARDRVITSVDVVVSAVAGRVRDACLKLLRCAATLMEEEHRSAGLTPITSLTRATSSTLVVAVVTGLTRSRRRLPQRGIVPWSLPRRARTRPHGRHRLRRASRARAARRPRGRAELGSRAASRARGCSTHR